MRYCGFLSLPCAVLRYSRATTCGIAVFVPPLRPPQGALRKSRFLGGGGGGVALSAAHISLGDKKANTLDASIGNQTKLEFNTAISFSCLFSIPKHSVPAVERSWWLCYNNFIP